MAREPELSIKVKVDPQIDAAKLQTIFYKGIMPSETGFRFSSGL